MTPRAIVQELDKHIIGQAAAKRAVAIALRNRWRRMQVGEPMRQEITPKNILMIGPTGVGKTEIARRLARLAQAPFVKVEATKFTEVGYVGREVDSIIKELADVAVKMTREQELARVRDGAREAAVERVLDALLPKPRMLGFSTDEPAQPRDAETRNKLRDMLNRGELDEREIEIEVRAVPMGVEIMAPPGMEEMQQQLQSVLSRPGRQPHPHAAREGARGAASSCWRKRPPSSSTRRSSRRARLPMPSRTASSSSTRSTRSRAARKPSVPTSHAKACSATCCRWSKAARVNTKYGSLKTDHVLFIASGAFHMSKPSDLIPELQGRFPIRVELDSLKVEDFVRILTEPDASLTAQYRALLETEQVALEFTADGVRRIAEIACQVNERTENIGARRLHTVMERLLETISYDASERTERALRVDAAIRR